MAKYTLLSSIPSGRRPLSLITLIVSPFINWWFSTKVRVLLDILLPVDTVLPTVDILTELTLWESPWVSGITIRAYLLIGVPLSVTFTFNSSLILAPILYPWTTLRGASASLVSW